MPVPARSWPARGSCASGKPGRPCPTCRFKASRFRAQSKMSDLRSDALRRQRSRHRSRPVARSRSQSRRVLAVAPPVRRRTARTGKRPELRAGLKAWRAARAEQAGPSPPMKQGAVATPSREPSVRRPEWTRSSPLASRDRRLRISGYETAGLEVVVRVGPYGRLTGDRGFLGTQVGQAVSCAMASSPTFRWPPLRPARVCCEHESVCVVLPTGSLLIDGDERGNG